MKIRQYPSQKEINSKNRGIPLAPVNEEQHKQVTMNK